MRPLRSRGAFLGVVAVSALGCAELGQYVWVDALPENSVDAAAEYLLSPGDLIYVQPAQEGIALRA